MSDYHVRDRCRLCDSILPKTPILDLGSTPLANEYPAAPIAGGQQTFPLFLSQCKSCGHVQLPVVVDPKRLFPESYPYKSGTSPVFRAHLKWLAETVGSMIPKSGRVLEIASNDGTLLNEFRAHGHEAWGIDPAAKEESGSLGKTLSRFFTHDLAGRIARGKYSQDACGPSFDAIVALNVFAHVDDLNDFTAGVAELLAPDGVFVFEVGHLPRVLANGLVGCIYHEHVSYHALGPLLPFFERHRLQLFDANMIDSQGGSIRCFVGRGRREPSARLLFNIAAERNLMPPIDLLSRHIEARRAFTYRVRALLSEGKSVAAFGAPAKLTTWSYALGLGPEDITCVYDDNPLKVGRYTPGNFWPIVPSSRLLEDNPDAVVLFSSNFEAEIRERFKDYRGEWIVV